jgi:hypothetical protein
MVERVNPFDFYWAPWAKTVNQGYCIHVMPMEYQTLYDCIGLPGFNEAKIREVLARYEAGYEVDSTLRSQRKQLEDGTTSFDKPDTIDVHDFWGPVKGSVLKEWGVTGIEDELKRYKVNSWVVDGVCIRAVMNPDPLGNNPFYVTSYEKVPGSLIGKSPPMLMRPHQEIINSAYRALRRNMGLAAGPFAEVDQTRLAEGQAPEEIVPGMVKLVEPDPTGSGQPVYRFHNIDSHAAELIGVIKHENTAADDATGIPAYSYGNASGSGVGRTVGGLSLLMGNASKSIKQVIDHIEVDVLGPLIQAMYTYNMLFGEDETVKVDAQVIARGPSGIIMREALVQRRLEALQLLTPYLQFNIVTPEGLAVLLREVLSGLDMPVDKIIPDPEKAQTLQSVAQSAGPGPTGQGGNAN